MLPWLDKDTRLCMSLSARPGSHGTRFHNYLYRELGLNFVYKSFSTTDLAAAVGGIRALGIRGCAVSMPFKEAVIPLVDTVTASAEAIRSVNTLVNDDGHLTAYNTDYIAIDRLLEQHRVAPDTSFALLGSGGMAKAVAFVLKSRGFTEGAVVARNPKTGPALAAHAGFAYHEQFGELRPRMIINATPIGMSGGPEADALPVSKEALEAAEVVFEVVAQPPVTPLVREAKVLGKTVITGTDVIVLQAVEQFELYTGVRPEPELVARAGAFARGEREA